MRIGIIGAGSLGSALGERLGRAGHEIMFGGGDRAREVASRIAAGVGSNSEAAAFGDVVVLAVPFAAIEAALDDAATEGRVLWSCVNAVRHDLSGLAVGFDTSAAEQVARQASGARVVAAIPPFAHAIASGTLAYDEGLAPSVFLCSDDPAAKQAIERLVRDLGAHPVDAGQLSAARLVEPAMMLLIRLADGGAPRDVGLRLLERTAGSGSER
jgi:8-hydroxy-5-deazaflavin:NADPH oxidoreductase